MSVSDTLCILRHEHASLDILFQRHQEMLVSHAWARAARLLTQYQERLTAHIRLEEKFLLPYCTDGSGSSPRWGSHVYRTEHRKLEELVRAVTVRLASARRRGVTPAMLIDLLDKERTLKHVAQHHHEREEKGLFIELRERLPLETRMELSKELLRVSQCI